ncbi:hypothetical protein AB6O49_00660 [Streptomyces sp. SBR177]
MTVRTLALPGGAPSPTDTEPADPAAVAAALRSGLAGDGTFYRTARAHVSVAGLKGGTVLVGYDGDSSNGGHTMVSGRWFTAPGKRSHRPASCGPPGSRSGTSSPCPNRAARHACGSWARSSTSAARA